MSLCDIIRVKRAASCCPEQNEVSCPSIKKSMGRMSRLLFNKMRLIQESLSVSFFYVDMQINIIHCTLLYRDVGRCEE